MLFKIIPLLVLGYNFISNAVFSPETAEEDLYDTFVDKYKLYREQAGCAAPLCNTTDEPRTPTCPPGWLCKTFKEIDQTSNCCSNCSCDDKCEMDGTCCPDKLVNFPRHRNYPLGGIYGCHLTSVKKKPKFGQSYRRMISRCDVNYKNDYIISQCEKSDPDSLEQYVPVFQTQTKDTYKNKFCALCNFFDNDEIQFWTTHLKCKDKSVFLYKSLPTIVPELRQHNKCNIVFETPISYNLLPSCKTLISTCNVTGKWRKYDSFVEKACSAYSATFNSNWKRYRNIFCFVCNMNEESLHFETCDSPLLLQKEMPLTISFGVILNFQEAIPEVEQDAEGTYTACSGATVYDHYKDECREITCPELTEWYNGTCKWLFPRAQGLCFDAYFWIPFTEKTDLESSQEPNQNSSECENLPEPIKSKTNWNVKHTIENYFNKIFSQLDDYVFEIYFESLPMVKGYLVVHAMFSQEVSFVDTMVKLDGEVIRDTKEGDLTIEVWGEQNPFKRRTSIETTRYYLSPILRPFFLSSRCSKTYTVSKFLHCAMISLDLSDFDNNNITGMILKHSNETISTKDFRRINDTHVNMCANDYLRFLPSKVVSTKRNHSTSQYILSLISLTCSICSILSLTITIMIYISFPALRTQPGINNFSLSISLLFAFIFLLGGSMQSVHDTSILCTTVGLMTHFFWLDSMFWMNVCCFHMFKSFGNMHTSVCKNLTQKYLAYSLILSFVFIIINIIYSEILDKGQNIGYGQTGNFCYIVHAKMVLYTMTTPTNMVLVSNLVMYFIVICRICRMPSVSRSTLKSRSHLTIYMKLSSFTGIAWVTYIPVMYTNILVMEIIFNILVSLQGVFIMLAFVCNRRVMLLLKEKLCGRAKHITSGTISRKTTVTSVQHSSNDVKICKKDESVTHI